MSTPLSRQMDQMSDAQEWRERAEAAEARLAQCEATVREAAALRQRVEELERADDTWRAECEHQTERAEAAEARLARCVEALADLVEIIDKAGLLNLSNGVQLGATSWYVKASERLEWARSALAAAKEKP